MKYRHLPTLASLPRLIQAPILLDAIAIAFIASTESLLMKLDFLSR
ncbi:hypothetical protein [Nostoc sp.]